MDVADDVVGGHGVGCLMSSKIVVFGICGDVDGGKKHLMKNSGPGVWFKRQNY